VLLSVEELERSFGGVRALDGAAVQVSAGEVHGLIGPNGAGKTTLLNVISGLFRPSRGRIVLGGERIDGLPPNRIAALGITRTYQNIRLFPGLSALENVLVGAHLVRREDALRRMLFLPSARADEVRARRPPCSCSPASACASARRSASPASRTGTSAGSRSPAPWRSSRAC